MCVKYKQCVLSQKRIRKSIDAYMGSCCVQTLYKHEEVVPGGIVANAKVKRFVWDED